MTTLTARPIPARALRDAVTMVRRDLVRMARYPSLTILLVAMPLVFLLLFVFVFGGTLGAGIGGPGAGQEVYLAYVVPGTLMMALAAAAQGTAITIAMDMTEGIVARFRTMSIARGAVLTGHVVGSLVQSLIAVVVVLAVAMALGFRPTGSVAGILGAIAVLMLVAFALVWLCVALGMVAKTVESASNLPMPLTLLPFLSSGFVPTASMPGWLGAFAQYQPMTPMTETVRGLLMGTAVPAGTFWATVGWSLAIAAAGWMWARRRYERLPVHS